MTGRTSHEKGYALASVLFLVTILSVLCTIMLRVELGHRSTILKNIDDIKSRIASEDGVSLSIVSLRSQLNSDSTFSMFFDDGTAVNVELYPWGLFAGIRSRGVSHKSEFVRAALLASSLTDSEKIAFVLCNLQHGLVFTGSANIIGDVAVGPMGVSTGNLRNYSAPRSTPITGKKWTLSGVRSFVDTLSLNRQVLLTKILIARARHSSSSQDNLSGVMECSGSLNLRQVNDSTQYLFCRGSLNLVDTILRRGPPLYIVVLGAVSFQSNVFISGPVSIYSTDSITVPPGASTVNCLLTSEKSVLFQSKGSVQVFSPVIHLSSTASADYPSVAASVSFGDSSGTIQTIQLDDGSRIEGVVMMHRAGSTVMEKALINLSPGATVVGGVYSDAYLTLDGKVDGYVRAFDLYFYESPTTYLGWMRQGTINRALLPNGFLKPVGITGNEVMKVLAWM